jgi:hypothetical protein
MMKIDFIQEPELEFGFGRHVDIRFGLMEYGPLDVGTDLAPHEIRIGIVGTPGTVEGTREWLERCRGEIPAKPSSHPHLFPRFPGFQEESGFRSTLILDAGLERTIPEQVFVKLTQFGDNDTIVREAVNLVHGELRFLAENTPADVLIVAVPSPLVDLMDPSLRPARTSGGAPLDFHDLLKARAMNLSPPVQLILPGTYDPTARRRQKIRTERMRPLQDDATRAWNFHAALYYKARGLPWRLLRDRTQYTTCFVGVSFYRGLDRTTLTTSMAQVFDERGDGMVIKGGPVKLDKDDRTPHLSADDAGNLLEQGLSLYREVHGTQPARIVVHKTSGFDGAELDGFNAAAAQERIERIDLLSVTKQPTTRLFRYGQYPPLRGTMLSLDTRVHMLYTRGSVDFYQTYPGLYVPRPLVFRTDQVQETPKHLAREMLALTKLNWNMTQFDGSLPITVEAARNVGAVLKYVGEGEPVALHYRQYM